MDPAQIAQQELQETGILMLCLLAGTSAALIAILLVLLPVLQALREYRQFGKEHEDFIRELANRWECSPEKAQTRWEEFAQLSDRLPEAVERARELEQDIRDVQRLDELEKATRKIEGEKRIEKLADACRTADLSLWADMTAQTCPDEIRGAVWAPLRQFVSAADEILLDGDLEDVFDEEVGREFDRRIAAIARRAAPDNERVEAWISVTRRKLLAVARDWQDLVTWGQP